ncbi:MAG: efflux RND transporter periplasmic adaptor subunit [Geminicoccaceae bacterium]
MTQGAMKLGLILGGLLLAALPAGAQDAEPAPPLPSVGVVEVVEQDIAPGAEYVGRVEAVQRAELRARVTGFLTQQNFNDGQRVQAGELLFVIEQEPFAAAVRKAEADLAAAVAQHENNKVQLARAEELIQRDNIAQATVDERRAAALISEASILQAEAALELAKITFSYTEITSPIDGRVGRAAVKVGNLVSPESGVLTTVVREDPIYATFTVAERERLDFRRALDRASVQVADPFDLIRLRLRLSDGQVYEHEGVFEFADVQVDQTTDSITLRGEFPNPDGLLIDRQFVTVVAELAEPESALVIPATSVSFDQRGSFVLIVNDENVVEQRLVNLGQGTGRMTVVEDGVQLGERVIVEGITKVRPGMEVNATPVSQPEA